MTTPALFDVPAQGGTSRKQRILNAAEPLITLPAVVSRDGTITSITNLQAAHLLARLAQEHTTLTIDVEHTGYPLGHKNYALRLIQIGTADTVVVLDPTSHKSQQVAAIALHAAIHLTAYAAHADIIPLVHAGLIGWEEAWDKTRDVMLATKLTNPNADGTDGGLKSEAPALLGAAAVTPDADTARKALFEAGGWLTSIEPDTPTTRNGWHQVNPRWRRMVHYAAADVLDTAAMAAAAPPVPENILTRERIAQRMTARISYLGLALNHDTVTRLLMTHTQARDAAAETCASMGLPEPGSGPAAAERLTTLGAALPLTSKGNVSVEASTLTTLITDPGLLADLATALLDYRNHATLVSTFLRPYDVLCTQGDGRVRPTIYTLSTRTGRMCLPTDHGLLTPNGPVTSKDIHPGTMTLDATGRWVEVVSVHRYTDASLQTLSNGGLALACTPEHRWVTTREHEAGYAHRGGAPVPARALRRLSDHPRLRVHLAPDVPPFNFNARTIPAETDGQRLAALIGMLVTDGSCVDSDKPGIGLRAHVYQTEGKFHAEFRRVIPEQAVMYDRITANGYLHHEIRIRAEWLRPQLDKAGLRPGAKLKESPDLHRWAAGLPLDEVRAFFSACWLSDGSLRHHAISCGSVNLRAVLTLAGYRLGVVAYETEDPPSEWSTGPRRSLVFRLPVITTRRSVHGTGRSDVWCVTTETGTFTAVNSRGTMYLTGNSGSRPNPQNIPREGGIRGCFTADNSYLFCSADLAGIELRVAAALSEDPTLTEAVVNGTSTDKTDIHWLVAKQVFGSAATKHDRYTVKPGVYTNLYGGGVATLAAAMGCRVDVARSVQSGLHALMPGFTQWAQRIKKGPNRYTLYTGVELQLPLDSPYKWPNYIIQRTARDILVDAMLRWRLTRWGHATLLPIHDELLVMVPADAAAAATTALVECMTTTLNRVPITASANEPSFAWADAA